MNNTTETTSLSPDTTPLSLWSPLHDGKLLAIHNATDQQSVTLEVEVLHLQKFHQLGTDALFLLRFQEVESVQVLACIDEDDGNSHDEAMPWGDFVAAFPANELDISEGNIVVAEDSCAMQIKGVLYGSSFDDPFFTITFQAKSLTIHLGEERELSLAEFIRLGEDYWDAWKE